MLSLNAVQVFIESGSPAIVPSTICDRNRMKIIGIILCILAILLACSRVLATRQVPGQDAAGHWLIIVVLLAAGMRLSDGKKEA